MNQTISGPPAPNRILPRWTWALAGRLWSSWHEPTAAARLEASCNAGSDVECVAVAQALEDRAEQSRKIAAHRGKAPDSAEGVSATDGAPGEADLARALDLYRRACTAAVLDGCEYGLRLARTLPADGPDHVESRRLSARGCALGLDESCKALEALGGPAPDIRPLADECADRIGSACTTMAHRLETQRRGVEALGEYERG